MQPGAELELGLHLAVPPGWHVYWENPGDTGVETSVELEAPAGFEVEGPLYPGPHAFEQPGELVSYGYQGDVVLFFRVRVPRDAPLGPARFRARAAWLVCQEACFLGSAAPRLELEVAGASAAAPARDVALLTEQRAHLPRPWTDLDGRARVAWGAASEGEDGLRRASLELALSGVERARFFPLRSQRARLEGQSFEMRKGEVRLLVHLADEPLDAGGFPVPRADGVLQVQSAAGIAYYRLDLRRPAADTPR